MPFMENLDNYDIMLIDHRGTGQSSPLTCSVYANLTSAFDDVMKKCMSELNGTVLHNYNTENAAWDLYYAIESTADPEDEVGTRAFVLLLTPPVDSDDRILLRNVLASTFHDYFPKISESRGDGRCLSA